MTPYKPKGRRTYRVKVPTRTGWVNRSTGTGDRATAKAIHRMVQELGPHGSRRWDLFDALEQKRITLPELWDAYRANDLDGLVARLDDVDLRTHVEDWVRWLRDRVAPTTARGYRIAIGTLMPINGPWWRSGVTRAVLGRWMATLPLRGATKRKYGAAVRSFCDYCVSVGVWDESPAANLVMPPADDPVPMFYERDEVQRLVGGAPGVYGDLFALIYGTGAEVSAAVAVTRRDVDLERWLVRMPGTKTYNRDRIVIVAEWARGRLASRCRGLLPAARLFPVDRHRATKVHARVAREQGLRHLKLHAARNHWAVRALRGGWTVEGVARQLGNTPQMVLKVYGRFVASPEELARLEGQAEAEARRRAGAA